MGRSPIFLTQSAYDYTQLGSGGLDLNCTPPGTLAASPLLKCDAKRMRIFESFGKELVNAIRLAMRRNTSGHENRGAFVVGCVAHGLTGYGRIINGSEVSLFNNPGLL